jgi:hypothetical protein
MLEIFTQYRDFKKDHIKKDILWEIAVAKDVILDAMLSV